MTGALVTVSRTELVVLHHLAYVIEALAEDALRDAGDAILDLQSYVDAHAAEDPAFWRLVTETLDQSRRPPGGSPDWPHQAAVTLSGLSRQLWKRVLPDLRESVDPVRAPHDDVH